MRFVKMDLRLSGEPGDLTAKVDYEFRLSADDELVARILNEEIESDELATYLAGGSANTPITVERTEDYRWVIVRFHFAGAEDDLVLSEKWQLDSQAALRTVRYLTVTVHPGIIASLAPGPISQSPHTAYFAGKPEPIIYTIKTDEPAPSAEKNPISRLVSLLWAIAGTAMTLAQVLLAVIMPWLVVLSGRRWFGCGWLPRLRVLRVVALAAMGILIIIVVWNYLLGRAFPPHTPLVPLMALIWLSLGPILVGGVVAVLYARPFQTTATASAGPLLDVQKAERRTATILLIGGAAFAMAAMVLASRGGIAGWAWLAALIVGSAALCGVGARLFFKSHALFAAVGLIAASYPVLIYAVSTFTGYDIATGMLIGMVAIGFLIAQTSRAGLPRRLWAALALVATGSLLLIPLAPLANFDYPDTGYSFSIAYTLGEAFYLLNLLLAVGAATLLRRVGTSGRGPRGGRERPGGVALRVPDIWVAGLVLMLCAAIQPFPPVGSRSDLSQR
jgi:hypothetical protein